MKRLITITLFFVSFAFFGQINKKEYKKFSDSLFKVGDVILTPTILFHLGSCEILPQSKDSVNIIASFIKNHPKFQIEVGVHTDSRGDKKMNVILSECRAKSIVSYLTNEIHLPSSNFVIKGYGSSQPLIDEATINKKVRQCKEVMSPQEKEILYATNRRVEIKILKVE